MSSCQRRDPLEGTASAIINPFPLPESRLPEDRPVGGYCKILATGDDGIRDCVARGETRWRVLQDKQSIPQKWTQFKLPEDRPVGGYCKSSISKRYFPWKLCCQRRDPLEGTARSKWIPSTGIVSELPEERPVGGYCKSSLSLRHMTTIMVARGETRWRVLQARKQRRAVLCCESCQRIDPLEGTASCLP